jgi:hypothetical protein
MRHNSSQNADVATLTKGTSNQYNNTLVSSAVDLCKRNFKPFRNNDVCDANSSSRVGLSAPKDEAISRPRDLLEMVLEGLEYHQPELCEEGINGAYFLRNKDGQRIAVFKPNDEEGNIESNPKRSFYEEQFVNKGTLPGEGAQREVAAYLLDRGHFHDVPQTIMAAISHDSFRSSTSNSGKVTKIGSLQEFIDNDGSAEDIGPKQFRIRDVHKIGVLDLRIFNTDRHAGNILVTEEGDGTYRLTPIDQGLSLPSNLEHAWFEWLHWPQAKIPFDSETRCYIRHINVEEDAALLANLGIRDECIRTMKISSTLLKKGAAAGLTLYDIGNIASRTNIDQPSALERMFEQAAKETQDEATLLQHLWRLMDAEIAFKVGDQLPSPRQQECERSHHHHYIPTNKNAV